MLSRRCHSNLLLSLQQSVVGAHFEPVFVHVRQGRTIRHAFLHVLPASGVVEATVPLHDARARAQEREVVRLQLALGPVAADRRKHIAATTLCLRVLGSSARRSGTVCSASGCRGWTARDENSHRHWQSEITPSGVRTGHAGTRCRCPFAAPQSETSSAASTRSAVCRSTSS